MGKNGQIGKLDNFFFFFQKTYWTKKLIFFFLKNGPIVCKKWAYFRPNT
jgi:hypothetical protein